MQTSYLTVTGMKGVECMSKVTEVLNSLPGVGDVEVSLADGEVTIHFNERRMSVAHLTSAVEGACGRRRCSADESDN